MKKSKSRIKTRQSTQSQFQSQVEDKVRWPWLGVLLSGIIFSVYMKTTYPSLPGGDSGELVIAAQELGVAHPPGYPVFTVLSYLFIKLIGIGSVAWRVNFMSTCFSAITSFFMFLTLSRLCNQISSCIVGVCLFCFMRLTWTWSVTAEVFSLNNLFISILLFLAVVFEYAERSDKIQISYIGSFICGLSLCNQHTIVVYVFCIALWVLYTLFVHKLLRKGVFLFQAICFCCGLLPYIYLPLSSCRKSARWTWGDQTTFTGFLQHVLRREYGTFELLKDHEGQGLVKGLWAYNSHILNEWGVVGIVTVYLSSVVFVKRFICGKKCYCVLYLMMISYLMIFTWLANLDINNPLLLGVVERFWIQSDLVVSIIVAVTLDDILSVLRNYTTIIHRLKLDVIGSVIITVLLVNNNYSVCDHSQNEVIMDFARGILNGLPAKSIVLTKGDLPSNTLRYAHFAENVRPDVTIFDQEILTFEWSLPMLKHHYPDLRFPGDILFSKTGILQDGRQTFDFNTFLDANYNRRAIFACIGVQEHESSWQKTYELWPYGVCSKFIKQGSVVDFDAYINETNKFIMDWPHPYKGFERTSWEHVATEEMWDAKTTLGLRFLEKSYLYDNSKDNLILLQYSYDIYHNAMDTDQKFPVHWHKNLALVCEKLSRLKLTHQKQFLTESVDQFKLFINLDQTDKDYERIVDAIESLTEEIHKL